MAQRNIDYGSFPDDPNADAIRTAFEKVQLNFTELYSGLQEQAVLSVNRTPGSGITVNNSTGNVVVSANIAQVRVESTTLDLSAGSGTPGPLAVISQGSTPLIINLPANITGVSNLNLYSTLTANTVNVNLQINGNTATFTGLVSTSSNVTANNVAVANILTVGSNANISGNTNVSGNVNVNFAVSATTVNATSNINTATANISGNLNANIVTANYLYGDGSNLINVVSLANTRILNGTSYANISNSGGNLNIVIDTTTRMVVTNGGANINGYANITGNVNAANFIGNFANGNTSITIPAANGNINLSAGGATNELVVTSSGVNVAGTLNATGNANVANLGTGRVIATGNISATQFISNVATGTAPLTVTSNTVVANLNADLLDGYNTATAATANTVAIRDTNGSLTANVFIGSGASLTNIPGANVTGTVSSATSATTAGTVTTNAQPNITSVGTLTSLSVSGNATAGNLLTAGSVIGSTLTSNVATGTAPLTVTSTTRVANLNVSYANVADFINVTTQSTGNAYLLFGNALTGNIAETANSVFVANTSNGALYATTFIGALSGAATTAGTVTTNAQPNITSVGTLTSLGVSGNITAANITANTGVFTGNGSGLSAIAGANVTGTVANATRAATVTTNAQPNITSVGTLTSLAVIGNVTAGNIYANLGTVGALLLTGTLTTASQPNITSVGTLSSLNVSGNITAGNANLGNAVSANYFIGDGSLITNVSVGAGSYIENGNSEVRVDASSDVRITVSGNANVFTVTGAGANISGYANVTGNLAAENISATTLAGNLTTNAQPNITSVGTLSGLTVAGISNLGPNSNVKITGGVSNAFLRTDGTGNLIWDTATLVPAQGANTQIIFNDGGSTYAGNTGLTFNKTTGVLTVVGNISAGNISGANNITSNFFTGTLRTNAQPNITSVGTLTSLGVNGTITGVNITANTGVFTGNGSGLTAIPGANVTGTVANATYATSAGTATTATSATSATTAGTVTTNAQPNITSLGTLSSLIINGSLNVGNISAGNSVTANFFAGTLTTAAQPNITSVGTLTSLNVNGTVAATAFTANTGVFTGNGSGLSAIAGANVTGTVANATYATSAGSATAAATVTTNAQPNITSVGTLTGLIVSGGVNAGNTIVSNLNTAGKVVASTLESNVATGTAPFVVISTTRVSNLNVANAGYADNAGNATTATTATSATTAGTVTTNAQPNITSVSNSFTSLTFAANGNITLSGANSQISGANLVSAGFISGNGSALTALNASNITTGTLAQARLANSSLTVNGTSISLGGSATITANTTQALSNGSYITGDSFNGGTARTWAVDATTTSTASKIVARDANANIYANNAIFTAVSGNGSGLTAITGANVTGTVANATYATSAGTATTATSATSATSATTAGTVTTNAQPNITSVGTLTSLTANGNVTINQNSAEIFTIAAKQPPTSDMVVITNSGQNVATAGVNGLSVQYIGGNGAIEASAIRSDMTPGLTSGSTWNAFRVAATTAANTGVVFNGIKFDNKSIGTGTSRAFYVGTGYDEILNYNGTVVINGNGTVNGSQVTGTVANATYATSAGSASTATSATSATTAGTVTTNAQPNITSVGTLTSLTLSGNVTTSGNIYANTGEIRGSNIRSSGYFYRSVTTGVTAAGTTQTDATGFTSEIVEFSTVPAGSGARLPAAASGMVITIVNTSANTLNVYPASGDTINSLAANIAYTHVSGATLQYVALDNTRWYTVGATYA